MGGVTNLRKIKRATHSHPTSRRLARVRCEKGAKRVPSTYLIVDSRIIVVRFLFYFGFIISLAFRLFPFGELIRTLASENKNPTILNMIGFRFIFDARLLIPARINNESYVSLRST